MRQLLQEDLEMEQVRVNSLTHMVVVVDENSGDSATAALESKLQARMHTNTDAYTLFCSSLPRLLTYESGLSPPTPPHPGCCV